MRERITFTAEDKAIARELLAACPIPRDRLPYTNDFEELYLAFVTKTGRIGASGNTTFQRATFWRLLSSAAKAGGLAKRVKG
jgi:hypothetical protein